MRGTLMGEIAERWILLTHAFMEAARDGFKNVEELNGSVSPLFEKWRESLTLLECESL